MKHIDELQAGGVIVDPILITWLGDMIDERETVVTSILGDKKIVQGIDITLGLASAGIVSYKGKLFTFEPGEFLENVTTFRRASQRPNASGIQSPAYYENCMKFGDDGDEVIAWSEFTRYFSNAPMKKEIKILGKNITNDQLEGTGWYLADGQNGTDDLRDRFFVVTGNSYSVGNTGGANQVTLSVDQMPSHSHTFTSDQDFGGPSTSDIIALGGGPSNDQNEETSSVGGNQPHENRPPYYAVVAIQFIG